MDGGGGGNYGGAKKNAEVAGKKFKAQSSTPEFFFLVESKTRKTYRLLVIIWTCLPSP